MLFELTVRNYALVDTLSVSFENGLNIITGETGAGKSIIVGALSFLLGAKTGAEVIRSGCEEASVSAVLGADAKNSELAKWISERDIQIEEGAFIVRRSLRTNGRGSIFIQNTPVSRSDLGEFMALFFDIHGQHGHESLLKPASHRKYLDQFAGLEDEALAFNSLFRELSDKRKTLESAAVSEKEREARVDLLSYAIDEIENAALKSGESRELETESAKLASFEKLAAFIAAACEAFLDTPSSALALARKTRAAMESASSLDAGLCALSNRVSELYYEAEDISQDIKNYRESLFFDPNRLEQVEERLAYIGKLKKKYAKDSAAQEYSAPEDAILAYKTRAEAEIDALSRSGENRENLKKEIVRLEKLIYSAAKALSAKRASAGGVLAERISAILNKLGMNGAQLAVSLEQKGASLPDTSSLPLLDAALDSPPQGSFVTGPYGADNVEFLFTANKGEPLRELARIASGGELSRVMLAIKTALVSDGGAAEETSAGTLIFDEIDTGIGGEVAIAVGDYLAKIGEAKQIFCVTHLAVIASKAHNHLKVEKKQQNGRTITQMRPLSRQERREEIARMLSGEVSGAALAHADELLGKNGEQYAQS